MDITVLIFLAGGIFLGWSLGANDAANVFGTAVGTRMVRFVTAATICSIFVVLGAVISGAGASHTLGKLGAINALAGSAVAAGSAAVTVFGMTRLGLPVSTSQAIVGAIIGWNLFSGFPTDPAALTKIVSTWVACPILAAIIAAALFKATTAFLSRVKWHLLRQDLYIRVGLILAGALGAFSLGANNIANVMGVFATANPFTSSDFGSGFEFSGIQKLFLVGGIAISIGVFTYSKKVMMTVGQGLLPLTPVAAWVVVVAHSIVLLMFASQNLEHLLASAGLPTIPLVPVSSSQAVIGGVIGIGLLKGGRGIRWHVLTGIASGWITTPILASIICFFCLFFMQNVFDQPVYQDKTFTTSQSVLERLRKDGIDTAPLEQIADQRFVGVSRFRDVLESSFHYDAKQEKEILERAEIQEITVRALKAEEVQAAGLSTEQVLALEVLTDRSFTHRWQLAEELATKSATWQFRDWIIPERSYNRDLEQKLTYVVGTLRDDGDQNQ